MSKIDIDKPAIAFSGMGEAPQSAFVMAPTDDAPTVVIFGVPRGGTTMVAGVAQRCGIDIGADLPVNLEDPAFVQKPVGEMVETIKQRNSSGHVWGWKFPRAASYIVSLEQHLRNPHYIIVWRDLMANSMRRIRRGSAMLEAIEWAHKIQQENVAVMSKLKGPKLLVSYEKATRDPIALAQGIKEFVGTDVVLDEEELIAFSEPGSYKQTA